MMTKLKELQKIEDKPTRKAKSAEYNVEYYGDFLRELRKTTHAAGCHVMAVKCEELIPRIIEASGA